MSKKMKRSPFLVGSSGNGIPSPGTFLKYLGLRWEEERRELRGLPQSSPSTDPRPPLLTSPQAHSSFHYGMAFFSQNWMGGEWRLVPDSLLPEILFT